MTFFRRPDVMLVAALAVMGGGLSLVPLLSRPAAAQFFDNRPGFFDDWLRRRAMPPAEEKPADYSRAPAPAKRDPNAPPPSATVVVFGDSTADYLAYGLEEALADTPEIAVIRKHKAFSGLIRYDARNDGKDWPQVIRETLAAEKPTVAVMLIGVQDRQTIHEKEAVKAGPQPVEAGRKAAAKPGEQKNVPDQKAANEANAPAEQNPAGPANSDPAASEPQNSQEQGLTIMAPEPARPRAMLAYEFRSEKWEEAYGKRIDETIAALKSTGAAVLWVGLPAIRGTKSTSDASYLDELYRSHAEKAGIIYVDDWDGFVDDAGRFATMGPDVEGQIRRLRTPDGVHFTKFGARKLAHYVERELRRGLLLNTAPIAMPAPDDVPGPSAVAKPGLPAPRPLAGPVFLLTAPPQETGELLGGPSGKPANSDPIASRVLVNGQPATAAVGRADDLAWPLRAPNTAVNEPLPPSGPPVMATAPSSTPAKPKGQGAPQSQGLRTAQGGQGARPGQAEQPPRPPAAVWRQAPPGYGWRDQRPPFGGLFGLFR
jgi:hypothetical protein